MNGPFHPPPWQALALVRAASVTARNDEKLDSIESAGAEGARSDEGRHGGGWSRESVSVLLLHEEFVEVDAGLETFLDVYLTCGVEDVSEVATVQVGFDRLD